MSVALSPPYSVAPQALHHHLPSVDLPGALTLSSGTGLGGVGPWQEPGDGVPLCSEVPCADPGNLGHSTECCAGTPSCPRHCCYGLSCPRLSLPTFPTLVSGVPGDGSCLGLGARPLNIPRACPALPDPGRSSQGHPQMEGPRCSHPPGLTLLRASAPVLPVLVVMAHVGATHARIDIFTERYF